MRHAGEVLETLRFYKMLKVDNWVYFKPKAMFEIAWDYLRNISRFTKNQIGEFVKME